MTKESGEAAPLPFLPLACQSSRGEGRCEHCKVAEAKLFDATQHFVRGAVHYVSLPYRARAPHAREPKRAIRLPWRSRLAGLTAPFWGGDCQFANCAGELRDRSRLGFCAWARVPSFGHARTTHHAPAPGEEARSCAHELTTENLNTRLDLTFKSRPSVSEVRIGGLACIAQMGVAGKWHDVAVFRRDVPRRRLRPDIEIARLTVATVGSPLSVW